jgi:hypothetical protein
MADLAVIGDEAATTLHQLSIDVGDGLRQSRFGERGEGSGDGKGKQGSGSGHGKGLGF